MDEDEIIKPDDVLNAFSANNVEQFQISQATLGVINDISQGMNTDINTLLALAVGILKKAYDTHGTIKVFDNNNNQVYSSVKIQKK